MPTGYEKNMGAPRPRARTWMAKGQMSGREVLIVDRIQHTAGGE